MSRDLFELIWLSVTFAFLMAATVFDNWYLIVGALLGLGPFLSAKWQIYMSGGRSRLRYDADF